MGKEIVSWKCANCYFTECKWSANCSLQTIFMQIMPCHYIAEWSLHLHLMHFSPIHLTVPGQQDLGYYSLFFQDILWRHEWVKNGKGPAGSNISWPREAEDLNLFCYSGSSFTKQSICNKWFISNLPFILLAFWPMIHLEILYKSNLIKISAL